MTAREMHLEFTQSLQQIAAHKTRKYLPGEIDWILNKIQNRFIQSKLVPRKDGSGGFEINQLQADAIQTLIMDTELTPWIDPGKNRYRCFLPADYAYLLSDWSYTNQLCNGIEPEVVSTTFPVYALRFSQSAKVSGTPPYYTTFTSHIVTNVTLPTDLPYGHQYTGLPRKDDLDFLRPFIAQKGGYWWEKYGNIYRPGSFLQPSFSGVQTPTLVIDSVASTVTETINVAVTRHPTEGIFVDNRLTPSNKVSTLNGAEFFKTSYYAPVTELASNLLYVYYDNSFTVSKVGISYVRKCLPISLSLGTSCELPEQFHQTICDLAVEYVKGRLDDVQGQQLTQNDNENRVIL